MEIAKGANLALTFVLELCLLGAFAFWGFATGVGLPMQIALGVGVPVVVAVVWGLVMAPRAARRLQPPLHQIVEVVLFGAAFVALYAAGQLMLTIVFAVVYAVNFVLRLAWKQWNAANDARTARF